MKKELIKFAGMALTFLLVFYMPFSDVVSGGPVLEALLLLQEYAREHVLLCLLPAFFIAGAISVFIDKQAVLKYFGAKAKKIISYPVAAVSGTVLAVCSCTVLPIFSGIYKMGAGLGPASAFLYSGPAINAMAIILTAQVLGLKLGVARIAGAVIFSVVIGLFMHFLFIGDERKRVPPESYEEDDLGQRGILKNILVVVLLLGILITANINGAGMVAVFLSLMLVAALIRWFKKKYIIEWLNSTWHFAKQIFPLLFAGVAVAGLLLGRAGHEGLIPSVWIEGLVGGSSPGANIFASVVGAFMYFATLTEVPILEGLIGSGMGSGPALALLLAGPALSLPNMLVISSVIGIKKTLAYIFLVIVMSSVSGMIFGFFV